MGTLVAMCKPTPLALWLADHTYVKCGNDGKAWGCWGSKTDGAELRRGVGSTLRADAIAGHDEKAGIRCYLVNGVCHQSANRILLPAKLTVRGARGYRISEARFGTYGRPTGRGLFRHCVAPFNQYPPITGDLPECMDAAGPRAKMPGAPDNLGGGAAAAPEDEHYLEDVVHLYGGRMAVIEGALRLEGGAMVEFMVALFELRLKYAQADLGNASLGILRDIRVKLEHEQIELEDSVGQGNVPLRVYPEKSDQLTAQFQERMLAALGARSYAMLFETEPDKIIKLADPDIAVPIYGQR